MTRDTAKNALGAEVTGYVHADVPHADRDRLQPRPREERRRSTYAELSEWVKKNPKQFGYNGIKGGMSGVGFVTGWVSAFGGDGDKLEKGPYDAGDQGRPGTRRWPTSRSSTRTS